MGSRVFLCTVQSRITPDQGCHFLPQEAPGELCALRCEAPGCTGAVVPVGGTWSCGGCGRSVARDAAEALEEKMSRIQQELQGMKSEQVMTRELLQKVLETNLGKNN